MSMIGTSTEGAKAEILEVADVHAWMELAHERRWTDGLPLMPPTLERVAEFTDYVGGNPQRVIGIVPPKNGIATVEQLAIQSVMAGAKPEYFPVIIAALQAMLEERFNLNGVQCTAHIVAPLTIVSGPIVRKLGFNASYGTFAGGSRANATVGRAIRLILWNIGGGYTGEPDRSSTGHPGRYTYCIAENQDANPWQPLHADYGLDPEQSAVTVMGVEAPHYCQYGLSCPPEDNLYVMSRVMSTIGNNNQYMFGQTLALLSSGFAPAYAKAGWTKQSIKQYLFENARTSLGEIKKSPYFPLKRWVGIWPESIDLEDDTSMVPVVKGPEDIVLVVAGGVGGPVVCPGWGAHGGLAVTRAIDEP